MCITPNVKPVHVHDKVAVKCFRWDKSNTTLYYNSVRDYIYSVHVDLWYIVNHIDCFDRSFLLNAIESYYNFIVSSLLQASIVCVIKKPVKYYKHWWCIKLNELKQKCYESYNLWCACNRPRSGSQYNNMRNDKLVYKLHIKQMKKNEELQFSDVLCHALLYCDTNKFWKHGVPECLM